MRKESALLSALLLILLAPNLSPAAPRYHLINLGILEGYQHTEPVSINNQGQIVGLCWDFVGPVRARAALFDPTGKGNNIDLGALGGQESIAASINDHSQIIGPAENSEDPPVWCLTAFDANGSGNNTLLLRAASGRCINNKGIIAGSVYTTVDQNHIERAALFDIDHPADFIPLGTLDGLERSQAYSINSYGDVVGIAYASGLRNHFETRAVRFDPSDPNNIDLGTLPGCDWATPFCINDSGQIVGRAHLLSPFPWDDFTPRAVLFDPTGMQNNIDLGTLPGFENAEAFSINNDGQIVGQALKTETMYDCAVMFDPTGQGNNINLNDRVETGDNLYLETAMAINDHGWITGITSEPNAYGNVAFLLVPLPAAEADFEPDGDVDLEDYAVLAAAWRSTPADDNWYPLCDISHPPDGIINAKDLSIFTGNYLINPP